MEAIKNTPQMAQAQNDAARVQLEAAQQAQQQQAPPEV